MTIVSNLKIKIYNTFSNNCFISPYFLSISFTFKYINLEITSTAFLEYPNGSSKSYFFPLSKLNSQLELDIVYLDLINLNVINFNYIFSKNIYFK